MFRKSGEGVRQWLISCSLLCIICLPSPFRPKAPAPVYHMALSFVVGTHSGGYMPLLLTYHWAKWSCMVTPSCKGGSEFAIFCFRASICCSNSWRIYYWEWKKSGWWVCLCVWACACVCRSVCVCVRLCMCPTNHCCFHYQWLDECVLHFSPLNSLKDYFDYFS